MQVPQNAQIVQARAPIRLVPDKGRTSWRPHRLCLARQACSGRFLQWALAGLRGHNLLIFRRARPAVFANKECTMSAYDNAYEIHVHGDVKLRPGVRLEAIEEALGPLWRYAAH